MCCSAIFLDFDGVILTLRMSLAQGLSWSQSAPDPAVTMVIKRCCEAGCRIVVSSSWRDNERLAKEKLRDAGLLDYLHSDWRTGDCGDRPQEITEWLARHPEVSRYRILDDDLWKWTPEQNAAWVQCHPYDGMDANGMKLLLEWASVPLRDPNSVTRAGIKPNDQGYRSQPGADAATKKDSK